MKKLIIMSVFGLILSLTSNKAEASNWGRHCYGGGPRVEVGIRGGGYRCAPRVRERVWVDGRWGCGRHGRQVWIPGYWTVI